MSQTLIYVTTGTREEAVKIGTSLVESRLCACANILPGSTASIYWWEDAVQQENEISVLLKTRSDLVEKVVAKVKEIHSYDCPCIIAMPITGGNAAFLDWIDTETT